MAGGGGGGGAGHIRNVKLFLNFIYFILFYFFVFAFRLSLDTVCMGVGKYFGAQLLIFAPWRRKPSRRHWSLRVKYT